MRVLVWQSYGGTKVFAADTPVQMFNIYMKLAPLLDLMRVKSDATQSLKAKMGNATSQEQCEKIFTRFFREQYLVGTHEAFEVLEFVDVEDVKTV